MRTTLLLASLAASTALAAPALAQAPSAQAPSAPAPANAPATAPRPMNATALEGKAVFAPNGERIGEIDRIVIGQGDRAFAVVQWGGFLGLGEESRLVPVQNLAMAGDRAVTTGLREADYRGLTVYRDGLAGYRDAEDAYQVRLVVLQPNQQQPSQAQADASRIVVQQTAPRLSVEQAAPRVTVQQPQPNVTVNQPQPQITVRQPQPTVTVDIPKPEIIVRMPQPDVNVAMAQPQVSVRQPQPQVQVLRPDQQPQVQVQRDQAQVQVVPAPGEPNVQITRRAGQPEVRYESNEPRVVVNQPKGEPNVRFEPMQGDQRAQAQPNQQANPAEEAAQRRALRERINAGDTDATGAVAAGAAATRPVGIRDLEDMNVFNAKGEELGEVDRVIMDAQGKRFVVIGDGGFLGLGRDHGAFPLERFWMRGDRLVIRGVTEQDIESAETYGRQYQTMRRVGTNEDVNLRVWK